MAKLVRLLELALRGLEAERARIENEIAELRMQLQSQSKLESQSVSTGATPASGAVPRQRRTMSAAARKRISEGMKRRYARLAGAEQNAQKAEQGRGQGLTLAGRKKLSEMMKARWAAKRRAGKKAA